jgi:hypothetical protein
MAKKRKRKTATPRLGPATNLRPAGAHKDKRKKTRAQLEREALLEEPPLQD